LEQLAIEDDHLSVFDGWGAFWKVEKELCYVDEELFLLDMVKDLVHNVLREDIDELFLVGREITFFEIFNLIVGLEAVVSFKVSLCKIEVVLLMTMRLIVVLVGQVPINQSQKFHLSIQNILSFLCIFIDCNQVLPRVPL